MFKKSNQIKCLPSLVFFFLNIFIIGNTLQAIAQRKLTVYNGDIPGRDPGCSIVSIDDLTNSKGGQQVLALEKGMTPEQVDEIISGSSTTPCWRAEGTEYGFMRWSAGNENRSVELSLGFRNRRLNEINMIYRNGGVRCVIGVEV
ncbi:hypothetical protein QUA41_17645 [Microcoleus sp. Pol11C1]|uniref:hypothetical protein n=1 Tax=unclassified Microcoleus TaxID=2642155 RepID=UPI002FD48C7E